MKNGRVPTGIYGLDDLMDGGFRENTINIVYGGTGVGKTTFGLQFSLFGLDRGEKVLYVSFEMSEQQIIRDCIDMGWKVIKDYIDEGNLKIIHIFGEDLTFPSLDIAEMIKKPFSGNNHRIVIDPFTYPTFYSDKEKRKSLSIIFQELRKLGTSVIMLEELANGTSGCGMGSIEAPYLNVPSMPLYLSDTVIFLQNLGFGEMYDRTLRIMKHRGSKHGEGLYSYSIETGLGIVVRASEKQVERVKPKIKYDNQFKEALSKAKAMGVLGEKLSQRIDKLRKNWIHDEDPSEILKLILKEGYQ
ncbi:MAG TPA: ATPase domain-containing protein [Candidatus Methanoperedens sp.]|nr:AAA family ATPase [Candidatus Methanoperedens sp.]HLB71620.1 ATPase domain-containing protein [Candidatus Methanoperedens sp.]